MKMLVRLVNLVILSGSICACTHADYSGDGDFSDTGWTNYSGRYHLDLGDVDLSKEATQIFVLRDLPRAEFVIGIDIFEGPGFSVSGVSPSNSATVRLELESAGQLILSEEALLQDWVRQTPASMPMTARLYRRGETSDVPHPSDGTSNNRAGVKASGGWGTYFSSEMHTKYVLRFSVKSSDLEASLPAKLTLVGWDR